MRQLVIVTTTILALSSTAALAGPAEGKACAAALPAPGQVMYAAVAPDIAPGKDVLSTMKAKVRSMVFGGKLSRSDAQANAPAVKACLEKLAG